MLEKFTNWLADQIKTLLEWFVGLLTKFLEWALDLVEWIPKKIWASILDALAKVIEAIPVPAFMSQAGSFFGDIPASIVFFFQYFAIAEGIAMILSALTLRFLLRRIPFIG